MCDDMGSDVIETGEAIETGDNGEVSKGKEERRRDDRARAGKGGPPGAQRAAFDGCSTQPCRATIL